jgi:hypothetical protein
MRQVSSFEFQLKNCLCQLPDASSKATDRTWVLDLMTVGTCTSIFNTFSRFFGVHIDKPRGAIHCSTSPKPNFSYFKREHVRSHLIRVIDPSPY